MNSFFKINSQGAGLKNQARTGQITTNHGILETPTFVPDATYGAVKHLSSLELKEIGLQMVLGNIYHLGLRPGIRTIQKLGDLHNFMGWNKPIITDSGGFQAFSLVYSHALGKIMEHGVEFQDHLSGKKHLLTPKKSISDQLKTGSDILMILDYMVHHKNVTKEENLRSVRLTSKWAKICADYFASQLSGKGKILMAIIQGANDLALREKSFKDLETIKAWPGYGYGGLPFKEQNLSFVSSLIPNDRIRYVMGCGTPSEILTAVSLGWDLFDCVIPTRNARHGHLYTFSGDVRITQEKYINDKKPIENDCPCLACQSYSRAYVRHLLKVKEPLGQRLATLHNLTFYVRLMREIRKQIKVGSFEAFSKKLINKW